MNRRDFIRTFWAGAAGAVLFPEYAFSNNLSLADADTLEHKLSPCFLELKNRTDFSSDSGSIIVDGKEQKLYFVKEHEQKIEIVKTYSVSTGKYGFGNNPKSGRTPLGIHKLIAKYGENAPEGTIFKSLINTGRIAEIYQEKPINTHSLITTRVLRLRGCEEQNTNTELRHIYIHGTSDEWSIGKPNSSGCIRMNNCDIIELYNLINVGAFINIKEAI